MKTAANDKKKKKIFLPDIKGTRAAELSRHNF